MIGITGPLFFEGTLLVYLGAAIALVPLGIRVLRASACSGHPRPEEDARHRAEPRYGATDVETELGWPGTQGWSGATGEANSVLTTIQRWSRGATQKR